MSIRRKPQPSPPHLKITETQLQQKSRKQLIDLAMKQGITKQLESGSDRIVHLHDFATRLLPPTSQPAHPAVR